MVKRKRRSSGTRFALGMALYAAVFCLLIVVGMRVFWDYIADFEASRDDHAIENYLESMDEAHIEAIATPFMNSLDSGIQNPEESRDAVSAVLRGELRSVRLGGESSSNRVAYKILSGDRAIGHVVFTRPENPLFGFSKWSVAEETYDFSWLCDSDEITVPVGWTVSVGGMVLDESYVVESQIPYPYLKDFYGKGLPELYQCTYRIDNYVGNAPFVLTDPFGQTVSLEELNEARCLDNCSGEEKAADEAFIQAFLPYYVECLANTRRNAQANYNAIQRFLVNGSDLDVRLRGAIAGQYYAHSNGETIVSTTMNRHIHLGGNVYLVEFSYELDSLSQWETQPTRSDNHAQIILQLTDDGLRAQSIYSL